MLIYIVWLTVALTLVFLINTFCFSYPAWYAAVATLSQFVILFGLDALIAFILHKLPKKCVNSDLKIYCVAKWEKRFYEHLGIKRWKDKIPEMGGKLCDFPKDKIDNLEPDYIKRFIEETCYAEIIHTGMALIGLLILLIWPWKDILNFSIPMCLLNISLQVPSYLVQRYNRPKLLTLYRFKTRKKAQ